MSNKVNLVKPTPRQIEWADCEMGVIIHLDIQVFYPIYDFRKQRGWHPDPSVFNPTQLDTDQWMKTAKAAGAKYAILTAKHGTGFCLWPTNAYEYSVKNSPWKNGKGDIVADFIASCKKYGIRPGLYYSCVCNAYMNVDVPGRVLSGSIDEQKRYNEIVVEQLTELWTNYGELFEIWFDGGVMSPEEGGPDITPLLRRLQPQAIAFQGPKGTPSLIRWVGNERGEASYPCWSTTNLEINRFDGTQECPAAGIGDPDGTVWAPAESDMPNRKLQWFWFENEENLLYSTEELIECYYNTVGRNSNLLLGMVIDNRGLVPEEDSIRFTEFGEEIARRFCRRIAETSGEGYEIVLDFPQPYSVSQIIIMEDIAQGELVREYIIEGYSGMEWKEIAKGLSIGHKRIHRITPTILSKVRIRCLNAIDKPKIRQLSVL